MCVCVSVQILAFAVNAGVTDGKENCGCVSVSVCLNHPIKGVRGTQPVLQTIYISWPTTLV